MGEELIGPARSIAIVAFVGSFALMVVGILWAPLAGWLCPRLARGRNPENRCLPEDATIASFLLLLPWFYLVSKVLGRPLHGAVIALGYVLLFGLWLFGPVGLPLVFAVDMRENARPLDAPDVGAAYLFAPQDPDYLAWVVSGYIVALVGGFLWAWSLQKLLVFYLGHRDAMPIPGTQPIPPGYLLPFKWAVASFFLTPVLGVLGFISILFV